MLTQHKYCGLVFKSLQAGSVASRIPGYQRAGVGTMGHRLQRLRRSIDRYVERLGFSNSMTGLQLGQVPNSAQVTQT